MRTYDIPRDEVIGPSIVAPQSLQDTPPIVSLAIITRHGSPSYGLVRMEFREAVDFEVTLDMAIGFRSIMAVLDYCISPAAMIEPYVMEIPDWLSSKEEPWDESDVTRAWRESSSHSWTIQPPGMGWSIDVAWLACCSDFIACYILNPEIRLACDYLSKSMFELGLDTCDWGKYDYSMEWNPVLDQVVSENAFHNAFKAIERLIGEPGKKHRTVERLRQWKISPDETYSKKHGGQVLKSVYKFHKLRDTISAHGSGVKRKLTAPEIIDLQTLARHILLGSTKGVDSEGHYTQRSRNLTP